MIETYLDQISKTLFSQKELLLSFVKIQNNTQINRFAEQYKEEINKLKTVNDEFNSKQKGNYDDIISNKTRSSDEDSLNQLKSQVSVVKSELTYLKSLGQLRERIEKLELKYSTFKKNQDFCSDFQFNDFLSVYESTMKSTTESIKIQHEDIVKLKTLTSYLQQRPISESILNSIRCIKHEIKQMKQFRGVSTDNSDLLTNIQSDIAKMKEDISQCVKKKDFQQSMNEVRKNENQILSGITELSRFRAEIENLQNQVKKFTDQPTIEKLDNDIIGEVHEDSTLQNYNNTFQTLEQSKGSQKKQIEASLNTPTEIEKNSNHRSTFDDTISKMRSEFDRQSNDIKIIKTSLGCIKHEMRKLKIQFEDNIVIAARVDTLFDKFKKMKEKLKLENSSPGSPKRNGTSFDDDSTQKIREDLQILKQNFVETFNMQNSSISNQSNQIKAIRKSIDDININKIEKNFNDRLKVIETKLQIITTLASSA